VPPFDVQASPSEARRAVCHLSISGSTFAPVSTTAFCRSGGSWLYQTLLTMLSETIGHKCVSRRFGATSWYLNATNTPRTALTPSSVPCCKAGSTSGSDIGTGAPPSALIMACSLSVASTRMRLPEKPGRLVTGVLNTMACGP
jgi:hypothetical protein